MSSSSSTFHASTSCGGEDGHVIDNWMPPASFSVNPPLQSMAMTPEVVIAIGTITSSRRFFYFEGLYDEYEAQGSEDHAALKAFIQALTFRRCKAVELLDSLVRKILQNPLLDDEDMEDLANIIADLSNKVLLELALVRAEGRPQRPGFYCHMMRGATQQLNPPDMRLAMRIADEMSSAAGPTWVEATLGYLISGFTRCKRVPYDALFRVLEQFLEHQRLRRQHDADEGTSSSRSGSDCAVSSGSSASGNEPPNVPLPSQPPASQTPPLSACGYEQLLEGGTVSQIIAACERAVGEDVPKASRLLNLIPIPDRWGALSNILGPQSSSGWQRFQNPPPTTALVYCIIDPFSVDLSALTEMLDAPANHADANGNVVPRRYFFLFSSLRTLCEKADMLPENHVVYTTKIIPLRRLFSTFPRVTICPSEVELLMRDDAFHGNEMYPIPRLVHEVRYAKCQNDQALPSNGGVAQFIAFVTWILHRASILGSTIRLLSLNPVIIRELTPLIETYGANRLEISNSFRV